MSCCSCCCVTPDRVLLEEIRSRKRPGSEPATCGYETHLVREAEEEQEEAGGGGGEEEDEENRSKMDISLLRERYKWTRESQKRQTQVFRRVSEELSEAVSIVPVTQGLVSSPWEPQSSSPVASPPNVNFDPSMMTCDPWHVHLGLHRRSCLGIAVQLPPPATTNPSINSSSRWSSCLSEAASFPQECRDTKRSADLATGSLSSSREISPFNSTKGDHFSGSFHSSKGDPISDSFNSSKGDHVNNSFDSSNVDPIQASLNGSLDTSKLNSSDGSKEHYGSFSSSKGCSVNSSLSSSQEHSVAGSLTSSDESSTPVASVACSPNSSTTNQDEEVKKNKENMPANRRNSTSNQWDSSTPVLRSSREVSAPALRLTRQLSFGGLQQQSPLGPSSGPDQHQHYYPFPHRKTPRKSEAARRLGMYSSF